MQDQLNLLKELQEIDQEIGTIEATRKGYRDELAGFEAEAARVQEMLDQLNEEIGTLQQEQAQLGQELLKERDRVAKVEARMPEIQTQKEYVAVLKEIDAAKKANRDLEEQVKAKQQEIAALEEDRLEKDGELSRIQENSEARGAELNELLGESEGQLQQRSKTRDSVAADLPVALLRKYQTLFKRRGGLALAEARNGACLGCNMQLPPQQFNKLLRVDELETCPHCNRILFVEQDA
ncbi:MAG: hypothetical protein C0622_11915 [Desulfuromonas sp.]|nr:MAG: hypothetical protein C0622_11915 [Desulfuromonas sp.]